MKLSRRQPSSGGTRSRDAALIQVTYRHVLRVHEVVALRWDQVDTEARLAAREPAQERCAEHASSTWARSCARSGRYSVPIRVLRLLNRTWRPDDDSYRREAGRASWRAGETCVPNPSAHVAECLPFQSSPMTGTIHTALRGSQEHPAHGALHGARAGQVEFHWTLNRSTGYLRLSQRRFDSGTKLRRGESVDPAPGIATSTTSLTRITVGTTKQLLI